MSAFFLGKNPLLWFTRTIRSKGLLRVFKVAWHTILDATWDFVHGTETLTRIAPQDLDTESANKSQATWYGATRARPLMMLLKRLGLSRGSGFVDFGSGKGRVVMIAAQFGFRKVVGIDFSEPLCRIALMNLEKFRRGRKLDSEVSIIHSDVVDYAIQKDETVFFLYDPFNAVVLAQLLRNIGRSLAEHPREIHLIYNSPEYHEIMEQGGVFTHSRLLEIGGNEFRVYGTGKIPDGVREDALMDAARIG